MSQRKLGGVMRYADLGPGAPISYQSSIGGQSVHTTNVVSGMTPGGAIHRLRANGKPQPMTIKRPKVAAGHGVEPP